MKTLKHLIYIAFLVLVSTFTNADMLRPFTSDGTLKQKELWLSCCQRHDYDYWNGGIYQQRIESDNALKLCVSQLGQPEISLLMLAGVRVGGSPIWPTSFRWGYGWPYPRFYGSLTTKELNQIKNLTNN